MYIDAPGERGEGVHRVKKTKKQKNNNKGDAPGERGEGVHGVVEDDADAVVEERLTKDKEV